jgi:hypothetical protein
MLHHESAQIVDLVHLRFVCLKTDSLFALSSIECRLRLLVNLRGQAFTTKVGGPVHQATPLAITARNTPILRRSSRSSHNLVTPPMEPGRSRFMASREIHHDCFGSLHCVIRLTICIKSSPLFCDKPRSDWRNGINYS